MTSTEINLSTGGTQHAFARSHSLPGYMNGFGNGFETEALPGALPVGRNNPQHCPYGLYAEQISGTPFTAPRATNERSWLYRIRPTLAHWGDFEAIGPCTWETAPIKSARLPPGPCRWDPIELPIKAISFPQGVQTISACGDVDSQKGMASHIYLVSRSMEREYFYNADGEMLFVPQHGALRFHTELGQLEISPGEIAVIPRGIKIRVELVDGPARGFLCENYGRPFVLPELGPIGANGLANARDFQTPVAAFEDFSEPCSLFVKWGGEIWRAVINHSPLDVVAWHGNYVPYKYDLRKFSPMGPLLFDHADPSIFTVLTSPTDTPGTANIDFVLFSDRWQVAEATFRPPWFHMNVMSEFMGMIYGDYDAKPSGFPPGSFSLHNRMVPHGPDPDAFERAVSEAQAPHKLEGTMAFMLETQIAQRVTVSGASLPGLQAAYRNYGMPLSRRFDPGQQPRRT